MVAAGATNGGVHPSDVDTEHLSDGGEEPGRRVYAGTPVLQPHVRHHGQARSRHLVRGEAGRQAESRQGGVIRIDIEEV
jgi:hypothetical protein